MALTKTSKISQMRVSQTSPGSEEWRVIVHAEVTFGDPEDPSVNPVTAPDVRTYRKGDDWSADEPEVQALCNAVFTDGSAFYPSEV